MVASPRELGAETERRGPIRWIVSHSEGLGAPWGVPRLGHAHALPRLSGCHRGTEAAPARNTLAVHAGLAVAFEVAAAGFPQIP